MIYCHGRAHDQCEADAAFRGATVRGSMPSQLVRDRIV